MIEYIIGAATLAYGFVVVRDFHRFIRASHEVMNRDQHILDQIGEGVTIPITHIRPDLEDDGTVVHGEFDIDLDDDEQTAVLKFIDQFRSAKEKYERDA